MRSSFRLETTTSSPQKLDVSEFEEKTYEDMINNQRIGEKQTPSLDKCDRIIECITLEELDEFFEKDEDRNDAIELLLEIDWSEEGSLNERESINGDEGSETDVSSDGESNTSSESFLDETKLKK